SFRRPERASGLALGLSKMFSGRAHIPLAACSEPGVDSRCKVKAQARGVAGLVVEAPASTVTLEAGLLGAHACRACGSGERARRAFECYSARSEAREGEAQA